MGTNTPILFFFFFFIIFFVVTCLRLRLRVIDQTKKRKGRTEASGQSLIPR